MTKNFKIITQRNVYQGFFSVTQYTLKHRLFAGGWSQILTRELLTRGHIVGLLPFDPITEQVVLIEQFRVGALTQDNPWLLECVAGLVEEETADSAAKRELQEEVGLTLQDLIPIYQYWMSPGGSDEFMTLFCGKVDATLATGIHGAKSEGEDIRVMTMSARTAFDAVRSGKINNATTIIALQWLELNYSRIDKDFWEKERVKK